MRTVSRTALVLWSVVALGGCAALSGLDGINEQECAPNCEGAGGSGSDVGASGEAGQPDSTQGGGNEAGGDATTDTSQPDTSGGGTDSSTPVDSSGQDSPVGADTGVADTGLVDTGAADTGMDVAGFDSGCGPLNVPANCGACNQTCTPTNANSASCSGQPDGTGADCSYMCKPGYLDCNKIDVPNTDGCECSYTGVMTAPNCCADKCPTQHTDGLVGQSWYPSSPYFYDCVPASTMNQQLAADACAAYVTGGGGSPSTYCLPFGPSDGGPPDSYCAATCTNPTTCTGFMNDCICWTFSGTWQGTYLDPKAYGIPNPQDCYNGASSGTFN